MKVIISLCVFLLSSDFVIANLIDHSPIDHPSPILKPDLPFVVPAKIDNCPGGSCQIPSNSNTQGSCVGGSCQIPSRIFPSQAIQGSCVGGSCQIPSNSNTQGSCVGGSCGGSDGRQGVFGRSSGWYPGKLMGRVFGR